MAKIVQVRPAGPDHQVLSVQTTSKGYRREPCAGCPWIKANAGSFPAEAFKYSAETAYDMAAQTFACHESGAEKSAVCAGFLLNGSYHNMSVRLGFLSGRFKDDVTDGGHEMFESYREMAEANGVSPDDPALAKCR